MADLHDTFLDEIDEERLITLFVDNLSLIKAEFLEVVGELDDDFSAAVLKQTRGEEVYSSVEFPHLASVENREKLIRIQRCKLRVFSCDDRRSTRFLHH